MFNKTLIMILCTFVLATSADASVLSRVIPALVSEASKAATNKSVEYAVEYFKYLFNNNREIAQKYNKPKLDNIGINGGTRKWIVSPLGNLNKNDISALAKTLKTLDKGREQTFNFQFANRNESVTTTQSGEINVNNVNGDVNINVADKNVNNQPDSLSFKNINIDFEYNRKEQKAEKEIENIRSQIKDVINILGESEQRCNEYNQGKNFYNASSRDCDKFNSAKYQLDILKQDLLFYKEQLDKLRDTKR
ncbi:hypothetical protein [Geobacter sp. SVR]|uniref:hypothetical protein n=1 Tax=Geobacter sp. SVR TaxID=2495594 RepID=UPI00143EF5D4|nr:hypothetical protein [Geobacter sp. SVR]BCS52747.1 hypothetical protein GSVR_10550 [Geobacter sp. SVR]GCF86757.1 hypothetical protein GSbR_33570 [Geobacter sp. SVR]